MTEWFEERAPADLEELLAMPMHESGVTRFELVFGELVEQNDPVVGAQLYDGTLGYTFERDADDSGIVVAVLFERESGAVASEALIAWNTFFTGWQELVRLDLLDSADRRRFDRMLDAARPDLVVLGPLYKLASGDPTDERTARSVASVLDAARETHGFALLLEAHSPYGGNGATRPTRPYGASLWSRWPEFGLYLGPTGALEHWRGARDERSWPKRLQRGGVWPWEPAPDAPAVLSADWQPTALMERVSQRLRVVEASGEHPTRNALATSTTGKRAYVFAAVDALLAEGYIASDGKHLSTVRDYCESGES